MLPAVQENQEGRERLTSCFDKGANRVLLCDIEVRKARSM